jgi:hypothetical protein
MARIVKLNEGQLRKLVRGMLNEAMGAELPGKHGEAMDLLVQTALRMGVVNRADVASDLDDIVARVEGSVAASMQRKGRKSGMGLESALADLVAGDYGDLADLLGAEVEARNSPTGDGYKLYVLPKRDEDLDDVVEHIGAWRQESGTLWPVLLNSGVPVKKPGAPFDGYYAIGFDPRNPELALDFADDIGHLLADSLTE